MAGGAHWKAAVIKGEVAARGCACAGGSQTFWFHEGPYTPLNIMEDPKSFCLYVYRVFSTLYIQMEILTNSYHNKNPLYVNVFFNSGIYYIELS